MEYRMSTKNLILLFLIAVKFVLQYSLISPEYELHRDEFLHLDQANHLAWGYVSVPPVTSWISYVIKLLGSTVFWIKFFPALFGALTIIVVWNAIEELKGNLFALVLGAVCVTFSVLFRLNVLYQPNSLDVLCWTLLYYFIIKYLNTQHSKWLFYLAITFALGFLNKYNILFLVIGMVPAVLLTAERKVFSDKKLYIPVALAFILIAPNLVWQYQHNFPVFHHLIELTETQLVNVNRWDFLRSQLLFFPGTFIIISLGLYALVAYRPFGKYRMFAWSFFLTIGIFLLLRAKSYYAIGLYPVYFAFGAVYLSTILESRFGRILKPVVVIVCLLFFLPVYQIAFPNKSPEYIINNHEKYSQFGMLVWEDGKEHALPQDFADMLGWKELAQKVDYAYANMPDRERTLVVCDNYGQAGAINFYSTLGIQAVSFSADYVHWFDLDREYHHLIRVKHRWERQQELHGTSPYFRESIISDSITNKYAREYGTTIFCFSDAKVDINQRIADEIREKSGMLTVWFDFF